MYIYLGTFRFKQNVRWQLLSPLKAGLFQPVRSFFFSLEMQQTISRISGATYMLADGTPQNLLFCYSHAEET